MGDSRRFVLFAKLISKHIPKTARIADVASGKGALQAALRQLGYCNVTSWDKRKRNASPRRNYHYGYFDYKNTPREYDAIVAMHPDEATDHVILYSAKHQIPSIVCPCCAKPSATKYRYIGQNIEWQWLRHLRQIAYQSGLLVTETLLPMAGKNRVLICLPKASK